MNKFYYGVNFTVETLYCFDGIIEAENKTEAERIIKEKFNNVDKIIDNDNWHYKECEIVFKSGTTIKDVTNCYENLTDDEIIDLNR